MSELTRQPYKICTNLINNQLRWRFQRLNPTFTCSPNMEDPPHSLLPICSDQNIPEIPIEIITEEEMALIEAAFAAATAIPLTHFHQNARSVRNITLLSKQRLSACTKFGSPDIKDSSHIAGSEIVFEENAVKNKKSRVADCFLRRFRKGRGLSITDLTGTVSMIWYELQKNQSLLGEDEFDYEPDWVKGQIQLSLEFWTGEREARYPPMEERWKCRHCKFSDRCPATSSPDASSSQSTKDDALSPQTAL